MGAVLFTFLIFTHIAVYLGTYYVASTLTRDVLGKCVYANLQCNELKNNYSVKYYDSGINFDCDNFIKTCNNYLSNANTITITETLSIIDQGVQLHKRIIDLSSHFAEETSAD